MRNIPVITAAPPISTKATAPNMIFRLFSTGSESSWRTTVLTLALLLMMQANTMTAIATDRSVPAAIKNCR